MNERWALNAHAQVTFRHWNGETVAHHLLSNDTHRLAEPAGWILRRLDAEGEMAIDDMGAESPYDISDLVPALEALSELSFVLRC